jgi:hypothetical protein
MDEQCNILIQKTFAGFQLGIILQVAQGTFTDVIRQGKFYSPTHAMGRQEMDSSVIKSKNFSIFSYNYLLQVNLAILRCIFHAFK